MLTMLVSVVMATGSLYGRMTGEDTASPSVRQPAPATQQPAPQQAPPAKADNQVLHILVGHSVIIRTDSRLRRVLVGNPTVVTTATTAANEVVVTATAPGSSSVVLWQEDNQSHILEVFSDLDVSMLREAVSRSFPRESIGVEAEEGRVVLTGTASGAPVADQIVKMAGPFSKEVVNSIRIAQPGRQKQIMLKVRFAQVDRSKLNQFGINIIAPAGGKNVGSTSTQQFGAPQLVNQSNGIGSNIGLSDLMNIFYFRPDINVAVTIKALEEKQILQILAEPNLLATDGEPARFLAGGELPYPVVAGVAGANTVSVQFKPFGVKLEFTPIVEDDDTIRLKVFPEVSSLDFTNAVTISGFVLPAIATRHAETIVELHNGQSFGIAGLLDRRITTQYSKVPWIGDVPILGELFRSKSINRTDSELVVIVTPTIVDPATAPAPETPKMPQELLDPKKYDQRIPRE